MCFGVGFLHIWALYIAQILQRILKHTWFPILYHHFKFPFPTFFLKFLIVFHYFFSSESTRGVMMMLGGAMMPWPYSVAIRVLCPTTRCAWHSAEYPRKWWHLQRCRRRDVRGSKEDVAANVFSRCFIFIHIWGEMIQFDWYFSNALKPPTSFFSTIGFSWYDMFTDYPLVDKW